MRKHRDSYLSYLSLESPVTVIIIIAALVVIAFPAAGYWRRARTTRLEAQIQMEEANGRRVDVPEILKRGRLKMPYEGEVSATLERYTDASYLALVAYLRAAIGSMSREGTPRSVEQLVALLSQEGKLPEGAEPDEEKRAIRSRWAVYYLRYRPSDLSVEVVAIPQVPQAGPAIIVRLPDPEAPGGTAVRHYVANRLEQVQVPPPFAPAAEVISVGWLPDLFRADSLPPETDGALQKLAVKATELARAAKGSAQASEGQMLREAKREP